MGSGAERDLALSRDMRLTSRTLKPGDINDRGFLSREAPNTLKRERQVDAYIPLKKNMTAYDEAVRAARTPETVWQKRPNRKRESQRIAFASDVGPMWERESPEENVPVNGCVVHDRKDDEQYVFVTTDTEKTARQIMLAYEMRPEIEEDYRQRENLCRSS
ncbi:MAG: transposase [Treponema sp.]|nr:transposase [Treponema sp.]